MCADKWLEFERCFTRPIIIGPTQRIKAAKPKEPALSLSVVPVAAIVQIIVLGLDEILLFLEFIQILAKILCNNGHFVLNLVTSTKAVEGELTGILE